VIERIFKFWLWNDLVYKMSGSGQRFFKSIKVLHEYTDNVCIQKGLIIHFIQYNRLVLTVIIVGIINI